MKAIYHRLTGCKTPLQEFDENPRIVSGDQQPVKARFV